MITFYFNSNLPEYYTGDLCEVFDNLMLKFILLLNDKKLPINGYIATNNQPSTILICGKTLKSLIDNFNIAEKDKYKEHRKKLYSFFTRYPIDLDVRVEEVFSVETFIAEGYLRAFFHKAHGFLREICCIHFSKASTIGAISATTLAK